jgi:hypothetical protein
MNLKNNSLLNKKVLIGALIVAALCLFYTLVLVNGLSYKRSTTNTPEANLTVIAGPLIPTMDIGMLTVVTPTVTVDLQLPGSGGLKTGVYVQINGTGGNGLRIRNNAGTDAETNFIANESEVFLIIGGPLELNDYVWWQLSAPYDQSRQGWAAADYLKIIIQ